MNEDKTSGPDHEVEEAWRTFRKGLARYLSAMTGDDHLVIEMPSSGDEDGMVTPYAQFAVTQNDEVRAELSGNSVLACWYRLAAPQLARLARSGWQMPDEDDGPNLHRYATKDEVRRLALSVSRALQKQYGVPHPTLMSVRGWGPNADHLTDIGLPVDPDCLTGAAQVEARMLTEIEAPGFETPRDELLAATSAALDSLFERVVEKDGDGDFVIPDQPRPVYVRVHQDLPLIEAYSVLAIGVRSRRQAAVETALLNRDHMLIKFVLHERNVIATMNLPAHELNAGSLLETLPMFLNTVNAVRGDVTLRTGARS